MATLASMRVQGTTHAPAAAPVPWWLWLSVPVGGLGIAASLVDILVDRVYADETEIWQAQAIGQDVANLVVLPVLLVLAYAAARGSWAATLAWAGTVVYAAYTYAIYAFAVHFGPLFLVYVAVLGAAAWSLGGFLTSVTEARMRTLRASRELTRFASWLLIVTAVLFALMWVAQDLPAMVRGTRPAELEDTGLLTNPVHVLDLAFFLPASMLAGVLLRRGRAWGTCLAPVMLTAMASISLGIVSLVVVSLVRDLDASLVVAAVMAVLGVVQAVTAWALVRGQG